MLVALIIILIVLLAIMSTYAAYQKVELQYFQSNEYRSRLYDKFFEEMSNDKIFIKTLQNIEQRNYGKTALSKDFYVRKYPFIAMRFENQKKVTSETITELAWEFGLSEAIIKKIHESTKYLTAVSSKYSGSHNVLIEYINKHKKYAKAIVSVLKKKGGEALTKVDIYSISSSKKLNVDILINVYEKMDVIGLIEFIDGRYSY